MTIELAEKKKAQTLFQETLRYEAARAKKSQKEIAEKIGVTRMAVHFWFSGATVPTFENVAALEAVLGCTPGVLVMALAYPNGVGH